MWLRSQIQYGEKLERFGLAIAALGRVSGRCFLCVVNNCQKAATPAENS